MLNEMMDVRDEVAAYRKGATPRGAAMASAAGRLSQVMHYGGADSPELRALRTALIQWHAAYNEGGDVLAADQADALAFAFDAFASAAHGSAVRPVRAYPGHAGRWISAGRYNCAKLVGIASARGWDNPAAVALADADMRGELADTSDDMGELCEHWAVDAENWLSLHVAPPGYLFGWRDLSFYLQTREWWAERGGPDEL